MAVTYGSNLGSNSSGAFALIPITASAPGDSFGIVTVSGGALVAANVPLTALQLASLNALYAKLNTGDVDALGVLSALVGVVSLDSTSTVSLSMVGSTLTATCSTAAKVVVFVPNSAASGIVVGGSGGGAGPIPTTQRYEAVANIPGLPLGGVACLSVPNPAGTGSKTITFDTNLLSGYASTAATVAAADFRVEKIDMSLADPGVGAGTPMFTLRFAVGARQPTVVSPSSFSVLPGWLYRIVNPSPANATLADVAITLVGAMPL